MGDDIWYLFKRQIQVGQVQHVIPNGERPPFPIVIENPTFADTLANMRLPEYVPLLLSIPGGAALGYAMTKDLLPYPVARRRAFGFIWGSLAVCAFWLGVKGSFYKLTGFENNGLTWRVPDNYEKKYNYTGDLEASPFDSLFKRKDVDSSRIKWLVKLH